MHPAIDAYFDKYTKECAKAYARERSVRLYGVSERTQRTECTKKQLERQLAKARRGLAFAQIEARELRQKLALEQYRHSLRAQ